MEKRMTNEQIVEILRKQQELNYQLYKWLVNEHTHGNLPAIDENISCAYERLEQEFEKCPLPERISSSEENKRIEEFLRLKSTN